MGSTISPYQGVKAVVLSIFEALHTQAGWLAWIYVLFGVVAVLMLFKINTLKEENIPSDFPAPAFAVIVLSRVHDQAARFLVTFAVSFAVFSFSLSLRGTGAQMESIVWLRAFPSLGFALLQIDAINRWYGTLKHVMEI